MQLAPGSVIASRYQLVRLLGRGGMGAVYLARHVHTGERVALKILLLQGDTSAETVERFRREMRAPALIRSEHVARVTDADVAPEQGGAPFLVMELLDGCDLDKLLKSRGTLSSPEVVWIFRQIAAVLDKAHRMGVVHRDLKPGNLFVHYDGTGGLIAKLLDFGIARVAEPSRFSAEEAKLTSTGTLLGTPTYMSPEQARGQSAQIGPASDVWSLGLIAFHLLTGHSYWQASSLAELIGQVLFAPMQAASQRAPHLPAEFDAWFARSCVRDALQRWSSVSAQAEALAQALGGDCSRHEQASPPEGLLASVLAIRSRDEPEDEDPTIDKPATPPAPVHLDPSERTLIATPDETRHSRPSQTRRISWLHMAMTSGIIAAMTGAFRLTNLHSPSHPPPPPIPAPIASSATVTPASALAAATPSLPAASEPPAPGAPPLRPETAIKPKRRPIPARPHRVTPPAPTMSGFDPEGR